MENIKLDVSTESIAKLSIEIKKIKNSRTQLFEDYTDRKISAEQFSKLKEEKTALAMLKEEEIIKLSEKLQEQNRPHESTEKYKQLKPFENCTELMHEVMKLIKGIYVYSGTQIEIRLAYSDKSSALPLEQ